MNKEYRLIQITESWDPTIGEHVDIFELTTVRHSDDGQYYFSPYPDVNNDYYVFLSSQNKIEKFEAIKEEIIVLNTDKYVFRYVSTPEGIRRTYFSKKLNRLKEASR